METYIWHGGGSGSLGSATAALGTSQARADKSKDDRGTHGSRGIRRLEARYRRQGRITDRPGNECDELWKLTGWCLNECVAL